MDLPPRWPNGKASVSREAHVYSRCSRAIFFFKVESYERLNNWYAGRWRINAGTGWPGVSMLWLGEIESLIRDFYLSVAARPTVWADLSLRYTTMLLGRSATDQQTKLHWVFMQQGPRVVTASDADWQSNGVQTGPQHCHVDSCHCLCSTFTVTVNLFKSSVRRWFKASGGGEGHANASLEPRTWLQFDSLVPPLQRGSQNCRRNASLSLAAIVRTRKTSPLPVISLWLVFPTRLWLLWSNEDIDETSKQPTSTEVSVHGA